MATITLNLDDSLLHRYSNMMKLEGKALSKWLETMLTREHIRAKDEENGVLSTDLIIDCFHLKGPHKEVPADDMGKGAIASSKFI